MRQEKGLITASRLRSFRRCKRAHHYRYDLRARPIRTSDALAFGSLFHAALEAWWLAAQRRQELLSRQTLDLPDRLDAALVALGSSEHGRDGTLDEYDAAKARALIEGYEARWGADADSMEVVAVEAEFSGPLRNPATDAASRNWLLAGKIDGIAWINDAAGSRRLMIIEHKTTSMDASPGSEYWRRLAMDAQIPQYLDGAAMLGSAVDGCLYDVIVKPTTRPRKATPEDARKYTRGKGCKACGGSAGGKAGVQQGTGIDDSGAQCAECDGSGWSEPPRLQANQREHDETPAEYYERVREAIAADPDRYYVRGEVARLDSDMGEWRADVWATAQHMRDVERSGAHTRNPDACVQYGRTCDYFDVCCGFAQLDDETIFIRGESAHPELDQPSASKEDGQKNDPFDFSDF